jgi:hypothetical protein
LLFTAELAFLPQPGILEDEALFVAPFLRNNPPLYSWQIGGLPVPVMSMAYLGAIKSWFYYPIFRLWPPGVWSIRLPVCILSLVTLILFADLIHRVSGPRVALAAVLFLATDAVFVLINVFDMTVCLLFLGVVAFLNLLHRNYFASAFFVAGLSLWYKANFIFPMTGAMLAFVLIYPGTVRRFLSARNILLVVIAFGIGSAPFDRVQPPISRRNLSGFRRSPQRTDIRETADVAAHLGRPRVRTLYVQEHFRREDSASRRIARGLSAHLVS